MKLDLNLNQDGRGKYAILKLRQLALFDGHGTFEENSLLPHIRALEKAGVLDWGIVGTEAEFFLVRLKDAYAQSCLRAYANEARKDDTEYAAEIEGMAARSGPDSPFCKRPD